METNEQQIKRNYDLLVSTLSMACPDLNHVSDEVLEDNLEELEGDYYTFLYHENIIPMLNKGLLKDAQVQEIEKLRNLISSIQPSLWTVQAFKTSKEWQEVGILSRQILSELTIVK